METIRKIPQAHLRDSKEIREIARLFNLSRYMRSVYVRQLADCLVTVQHYYGSKFAQKQLIIKRGDQDVLHT